MKAIILAGGGGTRLWPLSRQSFPKQFMKIGDKHSFLQKTVLRCLKFCKEEEIVLVTNKEYQFHVQDQLKEIRPGMEKNVILEPIGRNTAPAIALAVKFAEEKLGCDPNEVLFICPSDHLIAPEDAFAEFVRKAEGVAKQGQIITFGIVPSRPETGFGYIKKGKKLSGAAGAYKVDQFVEKPDLERAQGYLASGDYLYNSGMFAFTIATIKEEFSKSASGIAESLNGTFEWMLANFKSQPNISIDYAVLEKSSRVAVIPLDITWSDVGSWDSVFDNLPKDENKNVKLGKVLDIDTTDSMIIGHDRLVATIGMKGVMIVETADALLVARRDESQKVKEVVQLLKLNPEFEELTQLHPTVHRPWGSFTLLEVGPRYKLKRIVVNPGEKLSLQMHFHRSEHWVVVKGAGRVVVGEEEHFFHENESVFIPKTTRHRLENPGKVSLEIIEVQVGEYVGEDDIERFEDVYHRV
ncbi:mannose-1-phosphate guanylyltransferase/mannose-6-phosphate isomerase [bacterium CG2_30_54_10]|nr:MAG: mannose-1-phosphate guanylyltransferase/mannose-6-phosphate isomerase [bacterium CG2_30_54_10]